MKNGQLVLYCIRCLANTLHIKAYSVDVKFGKMVKCTKCGQLQSHND